ncbi:transposase family protein [Streptomyces sp. NPDC059697]|uniref:WD40 repeat domain-containing protein n=1 Tax=Streptomyces sp. NPDC059697 TaxID=3346912 RepID=UPI00368B5F11
MPDPRGVGGRRYSALALLTAAVAAVLAGSRSLAAIGEWIADAPGLVLAALGFRPDPLTGVLHPPHAATVRRSSPCSTASSCGERDVKKNHPGLYTQVKKLPWRDMPPDHYTSGRAHGRDEIRRLKVAAFHSIDYPGARQAIQVVRRIATGSDDGTVRLRDRATHSCAATLTGHTGSVTAVAISPNGTWLATGSQDRTALIWKPVTTGSPVSSRVRAIAFASDGAWLASGSDDGTVQLWDRATGACIATLTGGHRAAVCPGVVLGAFAGPWRGDSQ